ncbi:methyladenine glycosylase [Candidatus Amoebophilus asiaticus 5a2]|uniref:Methyladenine glycosylase n=1 Tax=Amoebophilus asiaticus (strain 5a2) TaxID=452471 RepID=B3EU91_AMOA5|nr:DNA-3-methyladenine glycosylase I [Candidatus Amoebophilus asiaticus]ACE05510.1 methyladenine glycosylase [Candidatus Amoebophilus asiaticus 5a2]
MLDKKRCDWVKPPEFYIRYHDEEWGVPIYNDQQHFEFLVLENAQAGLSFLTVLSKRAGYRQHFAEFDVHQVASFGEEKIQQLCNESSIIRNKSKIVASISNANQFIRIQDEFGSFNNYIWNFVEGRTIVNYWNAISQVPAYTPLAEKISKDLKQRGFKFVGSTTVYAYMQAAGLVNDHLVNCFRHQELFALSKDRR